MMHSDSQKQESARIFDLAQRLKGCSTDEERLAILSQDSSMRDVTEMQYETAHLLIVKSLIALGQAPHLLHPNAAAEGLKGMLDELSHVEAFYKEMGGIVGYHALIEQLSTPTVDSSKRVYHSPPGLDISIENESVRSHILQGICSLPYLAEVYPVGGAADRLRLLDPVTGNTLPAAKLTFCGYSLLEGLIRDLQAREYLYYKLYGEQTITPVAMMTSSEKENDAHIRKLCEDADWFGRPKESFRFFCQPLVPTMDREGKWCVSAPHKLLMRPGGHGVLWKVAQEAGILDWLTSLGRTKLLVRQINNPIAGVDYGLLAFTGVGFKEDKAFGFASCPREVGTAEGVNVLLEKPRGQESQFCLTNIEYCDFIKFQVEDAPASPNSPYSLFPSNTNILFADIHAVRQSVKQLPIPGMLVNLKKATYQNAQGQLEEKEVARLESTMQNLADCFVVTAPSATPLSELQLPTYLTYHKRSKTISTTKKLFQEGGSLLETPEGCLYDTLCNAYELLTCHCGFEVPPLPSRDRFIEMGPSFLFFYTPSLGPLYSIIGQKIRRGVMSLGSEMRLEIAEITIENLHVQGSLHICAERVVGHKDSNGVVRYSESVGSCALRNVTIDNAGVDRKEPQAYWKEEIHRHELCHIFIWGDGEFVAENVTLKGSIRIDVESGTRLTAYEENGILHFKKEPIQGLKKKANPQSGSALF